MMKLLLAIVAALCTGLPLAAQTVTSFTVGGQQPGPKGAMYQGEVGFPSAYYKNPYDDYNFVEVLLGNADPAPGLMAPCFQDENRLAVATGAYGNEVHLAFYALTTGNNAVVGDRLVARVGANDYITGSTQQGQWQPNGPKGYILTVEDVNSDNLEAFTLTLQEVSEAVYSVQAEVAGNAGPALQGVGTAFVSPNGTPILAVAFCQNNPQSLTLRLLSRTSSGLAGLVLPVGAAQAGTETWVEIKQ